jgi:hypothetical protein
LVPTTCFPLCTFFVLQQQQSQKSHGGEKVVMAAVANDVL